MIADTIDLLSVLETADAYLRTRVSLYMDFDSLLEVEAAAQRRTRLLLEEVGFTGLLDASPPTVTEEPRESTQGSSEAATSFEETSFEETSFDSSEDEVSTVVNSQEIEELEIEELDLPEIEELGLLEEPTQIDIGSGLSDEVEIDIDELDLPEPRGSSPFPSSFDDEGEDETLVNIAPGSLEPLPDVADLGEPDETEDVLVESEIDFDLFPIDEEDSLPAQILPEIEIEEPGEDALITIEDTSDPRSDLEGLSRLVDSDLDDDPDTGNDEVIVRTTPEELETFDLIPESDFSPDDEETFVANLSDIQRMRDKMSDIEDVADEPSENEVMLPAPEPAASSARVAPPRAAAVAAVAGVAAAGVAGVRASAGPQVTAGLYGNPSVPQIRDRNAPKPQAAAIQIDAAQESATQKIGGGPLLEEEEVLALGTPADYGVEVEDDGRSGSGLSLDVQEYENEYEEEEEEDDIELEEVEPPPVFDDSVDESEVARLLAAAEKAFEDNDMELAIDLYSDVLDNDVDNVTAHVRRGRLYLDFGDYSRAMSDFMLANEVAPDNPEPQIAVGDLYFARKDYSRAIGHFNEALTMDPNNAMAFCRRGISHYYRKRFAEALADLKQAQKLDDDIPNIRTYIAMAKKKAKR